MEVGNLGNCNSKNSNEAAQNIIEKALSTKCKRHAGKNAEFLHLVSNVQIAKICIDCIKQDKIPSEKFLDIRGVLEASNDSELFSYPVLLEPNLRKDININGVNIDVENQQIEQYILELSSQIKVKVENIRTTFKQKIVELQGIQQHSKDCWIEIINLQSLQAILLEDNNEPKLVQFINNHLKNVETNTTQIKSIYNQLTAITKRFSLEQPNKIKSLINSLLDEINFFNGTHSSSLKDFEEREENKNMIQKQQLHIEELQGEKKKLAEENKNMIQKQQLHIEELQGEKKKLAEENNSFQKQLSDQTQQNKNKDQEIVKLKQTITALRQEIAGLNLENTKEKETNSILMEKLASQKSTQAQIHQPAQEQSFLDRILSKVSFNSCRNEQNHILQQQIDPPVELTVVRSQQINPPAELIVVPEQKIVIPEKQIELLQQNQLQQPQPSQNNKQQLGQQIQQLKQKSSSLEVYNQYESLINNGIKNRIVKFEENEWSEWEKWLKSKWPNSTKPFESPPRWLSWWKYASTHQEWKSFSEDERLEQLRILKEILKISI